MLLVVLPSHHRAANECTSSLFIAGMVSDPSEDRHDDGGAQPAHTCSDAQVTIQFDDRRCPHELEIVKLCSLLGILLHDNMSPGI